MLLSRIANLPIILEVGNNRVNNLHNILLHHNLGFETKILVTTKAIWKKYQKLFKKSDFNDVLYITHSDTKNVKELVAKLKKYPKNSLVVAFGGGKVVDVTKSATTEVNLNYLAIPTALSNDGIYSPVASITQEDGRKRSVGANIPLGVIIDIPLVQQAPPETTISGIGDVVSNISALEDWKLAKEDTSEHINDFAYTLSHLSTETILNLNFKDITEYNFLKRLAYSLVVSGLAMEIAESSRPASGSEHMISNALNHLYPERSQSHGIQVAFATLLMEKARGKDLHSYFVFYKKVGLPTTLEEFGFGKGELAEAIKIAPTIRDRYTLLSKLKLTDTFINKLLEDF